MHDMLILLGAVAVAWPFQLYMTYRQAMRFNRQVVQLRAAGKVSVGVAGNRYRGGRAFVAVAVDDRGVVRDALALQGWTTLAQGKAVPALHGRRVGQLLGDREIPGLTRPQRKAARNAAEFIRGAVLAHA
jgi:glucitol operon activator protein